MLIYLTIRLKEMEVKHSWHYRLEMIETVPDINFIAESLTNGVSFEHQVNNVGVTQRFQRAGRADLCLKINWIFKKNVLLCFFLWYLLYRKTWIILGSPSIYFFFDTKWRKNFFHHSRTTFNSNLGSPFSCINIFEKRIVNFPRVPP